MLMNFLKSKIHRATVTQAELDYVGSITIDSELMSAAGILEYEKVTVANCDNGHRFETYTIAGEAGSGIVCINGAAAHLAAVGEKVIILSYAQMSAKEFADHPPRVVFVDEANAIVRVGRYERHGRLEDLAE